MIHREVGEEQNIEHGLVEETPDAGCGLRCGVSSPASLPSKNLISSRTTEAWRGKLMSEYVDRVLMWSSGCQRRTHHVRLNTSTSCATK